MYYSAMDATADYQVKGTKLGRITLKSENSKVIIDKETSDYCYDLSSKGKVTMQFKVAAGNVPTLDNGGTATLKGSETVNGVAYDVYEVSVDNAGLVDTTYTITVAAGSETTVNLVATTTGTGGFWFVDEDGKDITSIASTNGNATFTVVMPKGFFPKAAVTGTSPATEATFVTLKATESATDAGYNEWVISLSKMKDGDTVTITAVAAAEVLTDESTITDTIINQAQESGWLATGAMKVEETLKADGTHVLTITGNVGNYVGKAWWDATEETVKDGSPALKMKDIFPSFYTDANNATVDWAGFKSVSLPNTATDSTAAVMIALKCPDSAAGGGLLCAFVTEGQKTTVMTGYEITFDITIVGGQMVAYELPSVG